MNNIEFTNIYFFHKNIFLDFGKRYSNSFFVNYLNNRLEKEIAEENKEEANYIVINSTNEKYNEHTVVHLTEEKANNLFKEFVNDGSVKSKL